MTGEVCFGPCAEEERWVVELFEVMNIVEGEEMINKAEREDVWEAWYPISRYVLQGSDSLRRCSYCDVRIQSNPFILKGDKPVLVERAW